MHNSRVDCWVRHVPSWTACFHGRRVHGYGQVARTVSAASCPLPVLRISCTGSVSKFKSVFTTSTQLSAFISRPTSQSRTQQRRRSFLVECISVHPLLAFQRMHPRTEALESPGILAAKSVFSALPFPTKTIDRHECHFARDCAISYCNFLLIYS